MQRPAGVVRGRRGLVACRWKDIMEGKNGVASRLPHRSKIYHDLSGLYDRIFERVFKQRIFDVIERLHIAPGARVLEVGVGTGLSLDAYPRHAEVTCIDLSQDMLDIAAEKMSPVRHAHITLRQMDGMNLEFDVDSFDYVTAFHVVTVVPDPARLLAEITRVCKPEGQVVIINHFRSRRPYIRAIVDLADPVTRRLGWSTKLSLDDAIAGQSLSLKSRYKTSPWSLFTVVEAKKFDSLSAPR